MIVNFSFHKRPAKDRSVCLDISHTTHLQPNRAASRPPKPLLDSQAGSSHQQTEKRQFKIRTCSTKAQSITPGIHRPGITPMPFQDDTRQQNEEDELTGFVIKRFSTAMVPTAIVPLEGHPAKKVGSIGLRPSQRSRDKVFEGIDLFKTLRMAELEFTSYNMEGLMPLAHRVEITHNNAYPNHINSEGGHSSFSQKGVTVIVSFRLISNECKKYGQGNRRQSNRSAIQSHLSAEAVTLLTSLSGTQKAKGFLNRSRLFYKVSDEGEMRALQQCLSDHNLTNYEGIINVQDRYVETTNLYSLKGVGLKDDLLIIAEDKHTLAHEVPVPNNGQQMALLVSKNGTHPAATQLIEILKGIQCSPAADSSEKENAHPNIQQNQSSGRGRSSPSKRESVLRPTLRMAGRFTVRPFDFGCQKLLKKAQCLKSRKERRQRSRAVQERASSCERVHSAKKIKQRSLSREGRQCPDEKPSLEGSFKDKMVTLVKIFEAEKRERLPSGRPSTGLRREPRQLREKEGEKDPTEQLTQCLTSRLQNKTSYQVVGELLRNNSHIARQVNKYMKHSSVVCEEKVAGGIQLAGPFSFMMHELE